ncbi:MAG TPA: SDR family NAD(P)-dependent oxidoreductase [Candidatus Limnocylindrales bacterium]|nr:SDR family NAD(P)-dependent oxidoreductase [Candidatus Limnocylindrales bacterium]
MTPVVAITDPTAPAGRASARTYAEAGWNVALIGRGWAGLEAAASDVRERGRDVLVLPVDLADPSARALAVERIETELGPIEAWSGGERAAPSTATIKPRRVRNLPTWLAGSPMRAGVVAALSVSAILGASAALWSRSRRA